VTDLNRNDTVEYWKSRAETAELKVLTFHKEIAAMRVTTTTDEHKAFENEFGSRLSAQDDKEWDANLAGWLARAATKAETCPDCESTRTWYAGRYGKLEDWARKHLPEPWVTEFFNILANGKRGHSPAPAPQKEKQ
jgi:hypothetical protein